MTNSRQTMTPIFSMLSHNENLNRRNITSQNNGSANDVNLMHTLTDVRNTQNNINNNSNNVNNNNNNNNNSRNVNERTPITVIT